MALIMLAIGGLLALVGVYAIASGFPVIEVERGWSMVISGAVLLSGGLIVAALGIVVRTINGLKVGFPAAASVAPLVAPLAPHDEPMLAPPVAAPRAPVFQPTAANERVPAFAVAAPAAAAVLAAGAGYAASLHEPAPHAAEPEPHHEPKPEAHNLIEPIGHVPVAEHEAAVQEPASQEPAFREPAFREPAVQEPASQVPPPPEPFGQAWHEHDFSAFDLDAPHETASVHAPEPAPELPAAPHITEPLFAEDPATEHPEIEHHEPAAREPEPVAAHVPEPVPEAEPVAEAPSTAPETPPGGLSVIGRYDSDGTSYVMYSDGSIEAQSDAGVFRFNSMAELKAFIEG